MDRVAAFDDFDVGDGGIGHVRVDPVETVVGGASAGAAADGFVVAEGSVAEDDIVHGALAGGLEAEGGDEEFDDPLTGFDIAADDGWGRDGIGSERRIEETFGEGEIDGIEEPLVERERFTDPETEDVEESAADDGGSGVAVAGVDWAAAGEVDRETAAMDG